MSKITAELKQGILKSDRLALAQAITLVESQRPQDQDRAQDILQALAQHTGKSLRLGITGVPGVGKSTFIDSLGSQLTAAGHKVAVLAVDPSSAISGGSILGDKTRMHRLAHDPNAFIRPSPGGTSLGGVARRSREVLHLCEAAGYDVTLVETIGVGQSEVAVANMVDCFVLLMLTGAGDELQGIKRGIMELADVCIMHKADGDNAERANSAAQEVQAALHILRSQQDGWQVPVLTASSLTGDGLDKVWTTVQQQQASLGKDGLEQRRSQQRLRWFEDTLTDLLTQSLLQQPQLAQAMGKMRKLVEDGSMQPTAAALEILRLQQSS